MKKTGLRASSFALASLFAVLPASLHAQAPIALPQNVTTVAGGGATSAGMSSVRLHHRFARIRLATN